MRFATILVPALAILSRGPVKKDNGWKDLHANFRAMVNEEDDDDGNKGAALLDEGEDTDEDYDASSSQLAQELEKNANKETNALLEGIGGQGKAIGVMTKMLK